MKKISIILLAILFVACTKEVSVTNTPPQKLGTQASYYWMGSITTSLKLDSSFNGFRDSKGYYNEGLATLNNRGIYIEARDLLPQYRSNGIISTRFTSSKLGLDTVTVLQRYGSKSWVPYPSNYYSPTDTTMVWNKCKIRNTSKVSIGDTITVYATTYWTQPQLNVLVEDTLRIIVK